MQALENVAQASCLKKLFLADPPPSSEKKIVTIKKYIMRVFIELEEVNAKVAVVRIALHDMQDGMKNVKQMIEFFNRNLESWHIDLYMMIQEMVELDDTLQPMLTETLADDQWFGVDWEDPSILDTLELWCEKFGGNIVPVLGASIQKIEKSDTLRYNLEDLNTFGKTNFWESIVFYLHSCHCFLKFLVVYLTHGSIWVFVAAESLASVP